MTKCYGCGEEIPKRLEGVYIRESWGIRISFCSKNCYDGWIKKMTTREKEIEKYLKYPLTLQWGNFSVDITQIVATFKTKLSKGDDLIKTAMHSTIHLAVLWANNELDYLERLNKGR